ncbi:WAT1-related protein At2g39510-like [Quercus lobata]|uniref:WAT1-related protein At2g39510-like n=1 Tax=Quercus lobata TaxID=97700 RepID=UPI001245BB7E|nr:WAT1-related protein At2g39510-like [Quercus lobata]
MDIVYKAALNYDMSIFVLNAYEHILATLVIAPFAMIIDRKRRVPMTFSIFAKLVVLALLEQADIWYEHVRAWNEIYNSQNCSHNDQCSSRHDIHISLISETFTLNTYLELSLTAWICFFGAIGNVIVALVIKKDKAAWAIHWDVKLLAVLYGVGI